MPLNDTKLFKCLVDNCVPNDTKIFKLIIARQVAQKSIKLINTLNVFQL